MNIRTATQPGPMMMYPRRRAKSIRARRRVLNFARRPTVVTYRYDSDGICEPRVCICVRGKVQVFVGFGHRPGVGVTIRVWQIQQEIK